MCYICQNTLAMTSHQLSLVLLPQGVLISVHAIQVAEGNGRGGYHTMLVANITSPSALIAVTNVLIPVKLPR